MPTTTNYGWTTPADTDLVKDGASAIRTLGTAIDTTVFNNAGAAIAKSIVDAKGDLIAATAADTVSRIAVGSNNQVLTADSSTATGLKWATPAGASYAIFNDTKASTTAGGTFTQGAWRTRDLNTTQINQITGCSLSSNQIILPAGTYFINSAAPAYNISQSVSRFYNITDSTQTILGKNAVPIGSVMVDSLLYGVFTIAAQKTFELQHYCTVTNSTYGFGHPVNFTDEVYSVITIVKIG